MSEKRYAVTIYAAAPGTPLRGDLGPGETDTSKMDRSVPGHVFYTTSDGFDKESHGFGPAIHGNINGPGTHLDDDVDQYVDPFYARTMEISEEQYDKLNEFGHDPAAYGFDMTYKDMRNNCVDFTWAALNHAGMQRTERSLGAGDAKGVDGKLNYLPSHAPNDIRTIRDPMPGSELNREQTHERPSVEWWQIPLTEAERAPAEQDDPFDRLVAAATAGNDDAFDEVGNDYLQTYESQDFLQAGLEHIQQQALAEQALAQQQQPQQQEAPSMAMSMSM